MKKIGFSVIVVPLVLLTCLTSSAHATLFNWSYTWNSGGVLSGMLEGTIQADPNKIVVTSIMGSYTGPNAADFDLDPTTMVFGVQAPDPFVTFDGSEFFLITGSSLFADAEFLLNSGFNSAKLWNPPSSNLNVDLAVEDEGIDPILNSWIASEHWSITEKVPAPATLALFGLGLAGLVWSRRKA